MDTVIEEVREAAGYGAACLDTHGPKAWWDIVSLATLCMEQPSTCVVGQLLEQVGVSQWGEAVETLGRACGAPMIVTGRCAQVDAASLGWDVSWDQLERAEFEGVTDDDVWNALQQAWVDEIVQRRTEVA